MHDRVQYPIEMIDGLNAALAALAENISGKSDADHAHALSDITGLNDALNGKSNTGHGHTIDDVTDLTSTLAAKADLVNGKVPTSQVSAGAITEFKGYIESDEDMLALDCQQNDWCFRLDIGTIAVLQGADPTDIDDWFFLPLPAFPVTSVNGQTGVVHLGYGDVGAAAAAHNHTISDITGLQDALDGKAAASHTHSIANVTGLQTAIDGKAGLAAANTFTGGLQTFSGNVFSLLRLSRTTTGGIGMEFGSPDGSVAFGRGGGSVVNFFAGFGSDNFFASYGGASPETRYRRGTRLGWSSSTTSATATAADTYFICEAAGVIGVQGSLTFNVTAADSAVPNNTLFRSSDHSNKLCFKDPSGVVKVIEFEA